MSSVRHAEVTAEPISAILLKAKEMLGMRLCVLHNLYFYNTMMEEIRDALDQGCFQEYKKEENRAKCLEVLLKVVYHINSTFRRKENVSVLYRCCCG